MQALLTSFFVSNQISIIVIVLIIASIYLFNYMIKRFKITINLKKIFYDSPTLKINTLFTTINESEKQRIKLINKLVDEKIIDKKDMEKAINISKNISSPAVSITSQTVSSPKLSTTSPTVSPAISPTVSQPVSPTVSQPVSPIVSLPTTVTSTTK